MEMKSIRIRILLKVFVPGLQWASQFSLTMGYCLGKYEHFAYLHQGQYLQYCYPALKALNLCSQWLCTLDQ